MTTCRWRPALAIALPAIFLLAPGLQAQTPSAIVLDAFVVQVVTATKSAKNVEDVPAVMEVITAGDIRKRGYRHLADVLNDIPDNHQDRGNWGIGEPVSQNSGMGFRFDTGQNVLLLFNGFRLNAFLPGNRFGGEEYLLDNIERIEVIRGPGSALYGANAFTTVVNVITRGHEEGPARGATSFTHTVGGGFSAGGSGVGPVGGRGSFSGAFRAERDPGQTLLVRNSLFGDASLKDGVDHALDAQASYSRGDFSAHAKLTNQQRHTFTGFNGVNPQSNDDLTLSMYGYFAGAQYERAASERVRLKWMAGWHQDNWTEVALIPMFELTPAGDALVRDGAGQPVLDRSIVVQRAGTDVTTPFVIDGQGADTRTLDAEMQVTWNYTARNNVIAGINVSHDKVLRAARPSEIRLDPFDIVPFRTFTDDANTWLADPRASRATMGIYGQADYDIGPWSFTLGGRLDQYTGAGALDQSYTAFNPRGGVLYKRAPIGVVKLLFGNATRIPNGFETLSSVAILGTPDNRPERIQVVQAQWLRGWSDRAATEFGAFRSRIVNHLVTDADVSEQMAAQGFIGQFRNVPAGEVLSSSGVNGRLSARAGVADVTVNATRYFATDDGSGGPISYIPTTMANANVRVPFGIVSTNLGANYRGRFTKPADDPRPAVAGYVLASAHVEVEPLSGPWGASLGVRNLLNQDVRAPASSQYFTGHFPGRTREIVASARFRF